MLLGCNIRSRSLPPPPVRSRWALLACRADAKPFWPGRAYSSASEFQYSAARVALVTSRRAKRLKEESRASGASQVDRGGAARTLRGQLVSQPDGSVGEQTDCFMILSFIPLSSGTGLSNIDEMVFRPDSSISGRSAEKWV